MINALFCLVASLVAGLKARRELALENLALRQPLAVLKRRNPRPQLGSTDRLFWIGLSQLWENWREALILVKAETGLGWHRRGFRLFWRGMSRHNPSGRPVISPDLRALIRKMAAANPFWGAPRIQGEVLKLGIDISGTYGVLAPAQAQKAPLTNLEDLSR
jgi:putative transposase